MNINNQSEIFRKLGIGESQDMPGECKPRVNRAGGGPMSMSEVLSNQPRPAVTLPDQMQEGAMQGQDQKPGYKKGGSPKKWIQKAIKHKGALHEELGVPKNKKISMAKIEKAEHSRSPKIRKQVQLAETLKGFHKN